MPDRRLGLFIGPVRGFYTWRLRWVVKVISFALHGFSLGFLSKSFMHLKEVFLFYSLYDFYGFVFYNLQA